MLGSPDRGDTAVRKTLCTSPQLLPFYLEKRLAESQGFELQAHPSGVPLARRRWTRPGTGRGGRREARGAPVLSVIGSGHWVSGAGRVPPSPRSAALLQPEKSLRRFNEVGGRERKMREGLSDSA